jgi:hypothetical protein
MHRWNPSPSYKSFILSQFGRVACVVHHGVLDSTSIELYVGISAIFRNELEIYLPTLPSIQ